MQFEGTYRVVMVLRHDCVTEIHVTGVLNGS